MLATVAMERKMAAINEARRKNAELYQEEPSQNMAISTAASLPNRNHTTPSLLSPSSSSISSSQNPSRYASLSGGRKHNNIANVQAPSRRIASSTARKDRTNKEEKQNSSSSRLSRCSAPHTRARGSKPSSEGKKRTFLRRGGGNNLAKQQLQQMQAHAQAQGGAMSINPNARGGMAAIAAPVQSRINSHKHHNKVTRKGKSRSSSSSSSSSSLSSLSSLSSSSSSSVMSQVQMRSIQGMKQALQTFGPAPGAKQMLEWEREAAEHALATGIYVTWQGKGGNECTRVRPTALCFCGHGYQQHRLDLARNSHGCKLKSCKCQRFEYIPTRPEECGEWWLPRRKEFNVHSYQAKCKCKHSHTQHTADYQKRCKVCRCQGFTSAFLCVVCDDHSENHETVWETAAERKSRGASVGAAFLPLSSQPEMSQLVFGGYRERVNRECKHTHTYGGRPMFDAIKPRKGR